MAVAILAAVSATAPASAIVQTRAPTVASDDWIPPGWTDTEVDLLVQLVTSALAANGVGGTFDRADGAFVLSDGRVLGLFNLAAQLALVDRSLWPETVSRHIQTVLALSESDVFAQPYGTIAPQLRIRVAEHEAIGAPPGALVGQQLAGDLHAFVVVDQPDSVLYVPSGLTETWAVDEAEMLLTAMIQTLQQPVQAETVSGGGAYVLGDFYAASRVLGPQSVLGPIGPNGAVISIPTTDFFFAIPVEVVEIELLIQLNIDNRADYATMPNAVSNDMYWWHEGVLEVITSEDQQLRLPPALDAIITGTAGKR